jgi:hypothetical protein
MKQRARERARVAGALSRSRSNTKHQRDVALICHAFSKQGARALPRKVVMSGSKVEESAEKAGEAAQFSSRNPVSKRTAHRTLRVRFLVGPPVVITQIVQGTAIQD